MELKAQLSQLEGHVQKIDAVIKALFLARVSIDELSAKRGC